MSLETWTLVGTWVGAIGQTATAVAVFLYTRRSVRATATSYSKELVNGWNAFAVSTPEHVRALGELRSPVLGYPKDSMVFSCLNFLHANFVVRQEGLITAENERKVS
jgi:hypothetical protein